MVQAQQPHAQVAAAWAFSQLNRDVQDLTTSRAVEAHAKMVATQRGVVMLGVVLQVLGVLLSTTVTPVGAKVLEVSPSNFQAMMSSARKPLYVSFYSPGKDSLRYDKNPASVCTYRSTSVQCVSRLCKWSNS